MNRLSIQERVKILGCLVEGNSIRATARITDTDKKTVLRLLAELGEVCLHLHDERVRNVGARRVQCDEIWSFVGAKEKNIPREKRGEFGRGDVYTWTAIDADTKLIVSWLVGRRGPEYARAFMVDLAARVKGRFQLTTDGHKAYLEGVDFAFATEIDYAMLVKLYGMSHGKTTSERKYSPGECCGAIKGVVCGEPDEKHISTSFVERQNLTMRMSMRRFTRLTNAFSKKVENHIHALAIYFAHYNFCRIHQTLRVTPAMEAGLTDHVWSLEEIVRLTETPEKLPIAA